MNLDKQLSTLNAFLTSKDRQAEWFTIDQVLGMETSTHISPEPLSDVYQAYEIFDCDEAVIDQWLYDDAIRSARAHISNEIDQALYDKHFTIAEFYPDDVNATRPTDAFAQWCDGYLRGYMLIEDHWDEAFEFLAGEDDRFAGFQDEMHHFLSLLATCADWDEAIAESEKPENLQTGYAMIFGLIDETLIRYHQLALVLEENRLRDEPPETYIREEAKIGRNDPCPCGSGKKYKKCCLNNV